MPPIVMHMVTRDYLPANAKLVDVYVCCAGAMLAR